MGLEESNSPKTIHSPECFPVRDMGPWVRTQLHEDLSACAPGWSCRVLAHSCGQDEEGWTVWARVVRCPQGHPPSGDCVSALALTPASVHALHSAMAMTLQMDLIKTPVLGLGFCSGFRDSDCVSADRQWNAGEGSSAGETGRQGVDFIWQRQSLMLSCHLSYWPRNSLKSSKEKN